MKVAFLGLQLCQHVLFRMGSLKVIDISDNLFLLLTKGNNLDSNGMFDEKNLIKKSIRSETIDRVNKCKEWTEEAIPKIVLEKTGKEATPEFIEGATRTFGTWWLNSLEDLKKGL